MSSAQCFECGLIDGDYLNNNQCLALKRNLKSEDLNRSWECYYYISIIKENGERLTPFEHYLLKLDEIEQKKVSIVAMALK